MGARVRVARREAIIDLVWLGMISLLALCVLSACGSNPNDEQLPPDGTLPLPRSTPPPQNLVLPGQTAEGELEAGETDRWVFAAAAGELITLELWFRPASASSPDARIEASLVAPDGEVFLQQGGTVTLPPYIVEHEVPQTGSYLVRLEAPYGTPGRYTLLVTMSEEPLLTRADVYTSTLPGLAPVPAAQGGGGSWGFIWPSPHRGISGWYFHDPENPNHAGLDIVARMNDPLSAAAAGTVSFAGSSGGYGNLVVIDHADGWQTWYAHLSSIYLVPGQELEQGDVIGEAGSTGYSTGPHLHFELRYEGQPMDPLVFLR